MKQYHDALQHILSNGSVRKDRTGVGTIGVFGYQMRFNLADGFPAVTTKKLAWKAVVSELLWFLEGSTDERRLAEIHYGTRDPSKRTIWTDNALHQAVELGYRVDDEVRDLGPIYGYQWRSWGAWTNNTPIDQIENLIKGLKQNPFSRRHIINAWNVSDIDSMALPPCHVMTQWHVSNDRRLSCQLYQRSADFGLGVPFNIASYSLMIHMIAQIVGLEVGSFVHTVGDAHIYLNHIDQVNEQLKREPRPLPKLMMPEFSTFDELLDTEVSDYTLVGYNPHPTIKMKMAI